MKFAVIPWVESLMKDHLFEVDNAIENPDNRYTPYSDMKAEFERRGDQFHTIDMYEKLEEIVQKNFDLTPKGIINRFDLRRPIYKQTAAYGHFGRNDLDLPWEKLDMVDVFKQ